MLWNRWDEVVASGDVRDAVRRRFHTLVDPAGLDEDRAADWVVLRVGRTNASWELEDGAAGRGAGPRVDDRERQRSQGGPGLAGQRRVPTRTSESQPGRLRRR